MQYGSKRGEKGVKLNNFNVQERKKSRISERACAEMIDYVNCCPEQHHIKLVRHLLMQLLKSLVFKPLQQLFSKWACKGNYHPSKD